MFVAFQMRHLFVVVDMSRAMEEADLKPSRLACSVKVLYSSPHYNTSSRILLECILILMLQSARLSRRTLSAISGLM